MLKMRAQRICAIVYVSLHGFVWLLLLGLTRPRTKHVARVSIFAFFFADVSCSASFCFDAPSSTFILVVSSSFFSASFAVLGSAST